MCFDRHNCNEEQNAVNAIVPYVPVGVLSKAHLGAHEPGGKDSPRAAAPALLIGQWPDGFERGSASLHRTQQRGPRASA